MTDFERVNMINTRNQIKMEGGGSDYLGKTASMYLCDSRGRHCPSCMMAYGCCSRMPYCPNSY